MILRPREMRVLLDLFDESIREGSLSAEHLDVFTGDPMDLVRAFDGEEILNVTIVTRPKQRKDSHT